ncbi:WW domain binding protein 11 [Ophiocordyceps sinensis CO18]|uniref:WW domain binding protein 11 n=1 Tax=Ophiocordyceps sinensis (strain Co18 / CGMCC 3.14243) TaxID=911162 RepID=T5AA99_OPHSC|nr:WW domain binding protein 11 [Ophiocordyceps sinensis CO18]
MPKEKNYNPAEVQEKRNERLARKNPDRIQKQIDDLKAITSKGGKLTSHEEQVLVGLDKELKAVKKAREAVGDNAPSFSRGRDGDSRPGVLGKRSRGSQDASSSDEDVPDDVRGIPMPRDTPPPISKDIMDQWWAKRRARRNMAFADRHDGRGDDSRGAAGPGDTCDTGRVEDGRGPPTRQTPVTEYKTVYEAKPIMRNLRKEAVAAFVPAAVQMKMAKGQGQGGLLEPEEADRLEREGYLKTTREDRQSRQGGAEQTPRTATVEDAHEDKGC